MISRRQLLGRGAVLSGALVAGSMINASSSLGNVEQHPFTTPVPIVDPNSSQYVQFFVNHASSANVMSDSDWGIPLIKASVPGSVRWPANWSDGTHTTGVPMGAHIQLDPTYDVSGLKPWVQAFAQALISYGAFVVDTGGSLAFYGESSLTASWPSDFVKTDIRAIDWTRLRVLTS